MTDPRPLIPRAAPVAVAGVAALGVAAALGSAQISSLTLVALLCIAVCTAAIWLEQRRSGDWLNGATFLLLPVALGFGARALSLTWGGDHLTYPAWAPAGLRDQLAERAMWVAIAGAVAAYAGYVAGDTLGGHRPLTAPRVYDPGRVRIALRVLAAVGAAGFAALVVKLGGVEYFRDLAHARLDTSGLGVFKLASLGARFALLLWLACTPNPSRRRLLLACAVVLLLTTGQRSAVFATLIPVAIVFHNRVRPLSARSLGLVALAAAVLAVGLVGWRDATRGPASPGPAAAAHSIFGSSLVSLDGLVLVQQAVPADQPPNLGSHLPMIAEGYIPHAIWPSKPQWESNILAHRYLQTAHSGVFLSGFGTLWAIGLLPGVIAGSLLLGALVGWAYRRMRRSPSPGWVLGFAVIALGAARFMLAGDEISLFFLSQALLAVGVVILAVSRPQRPTLTPV